MIERLCAWLRGKRTKRCEICLHPIMSGEAYFIRKRSELTDIYTHLACDVPMQERVCQMLADYVRAHSVLDASEATR